MSDNNWVALTTIEASERSLHVYGAIEAPHPGYNTQLAPAPAQLAGPSTLLMNLSLKALPGEWPKRRTTIPVAYEDQLYTGKYKSVKVLCGGAVVAAVDVQSSPSRTGARVTV